MMVLLLLLMLKVADNFPITLVYAAVFSSLNKQIIYLTYEVSC